MNANRINHTCLFRTIAILTLLFLSVGSSAAVLERTKNTGDEQALGTVDFRVSCTDTTRPAFDRALALMHHMMYVEARAAFERIIEQDPDCAMAYWGAATTLFQPLWGTRPSADELNRGYSLIQKARELKPATKRDRRLVAATEAFFRDPETADFQTRISRWAEAMKTAHRAHPAEHDTAALYTLSLLALAQRAEDRGPLLDEAEAVLRGIYEQEPTHPGAIHYTIHATDADGRADRALEIVRRYGEIAPEVPHALHMPSHIYVRLGGWPEVIDWNRRSAEAALKHPAGKDVSHHFPHAADYLLYAYLQQGEDKLARAIMEEALSKDHFQPSFISAYHLAAMPARYAVERRDWREATELEPRSPDYLPWDKAAWAEGLTWLARGLGGVHTGDLQRAQEAEARLADLRDKASSDGDKAFATYIETDRLILAGWIARTQGEASKAVNLIEKAAELEATVEKHPVSPGALLPPHEALGDLLMDLGRPAEAHKAYQTSEKIWPKRYNTMLGAARAAAAAGDEENARAHYEKLLEVAGGSERPGVAEAKSYLGKR